MALINDHERQGDPRNVINQIKDPRIVPQVTPTPEEAQGLGQDIPQPIQVDPDDEVLRDAESPGIDTEDMPVEGRSVNPITHDAPPNLIADVIPLSQDDQIFPSVSDINVQTEEEAQALQAQQLEKAQSSLRSGMLNGTVFPSLYETEHTRSNIYELQNRTNSLVHQSVEDGIKRLYQGLHNPIKERIQLPSERGDVQPSLDSSKPLGTDVTGVISPLYNRVAGDPDEFSSPFATNVGGSTFDPLKGVFQFADELMTDPRKALPRFFAPFGGGFVGGAEFGDYPKGALGAVLYGLDLTTNVPIAAGTDVLNWIKGKERKKGEPLNIVQALAGKDFSFSNERDASRPLSVVNPSTEVPKTWQEWRERTWTGKVDGWILQGLSGLFTGDFENVPQAPANVIRSGAKKLLGQDSQFAEELPGRLLQTKEFLTGLGLDALTGELAEGALKGVGRIFGVGRKSAKVAAQRAATAIETGTPDLLAEAPTIDTVKNADVSAAIADFDAKVGEIEEVLSKDLSQTNTLPTLGGEAKVSDVVDDLTAAPLELQENIVKRPATFAEPPPVKFPSDSIAADGITRETTPLATLLGSDPKDFNLVVPESLDTVRRSNADLTNLAIARGDIPARSTPLSSRRLEQLNEAHDGLYSRYGQRLNEIDLKNVPESTIEAKAVDNFFDDVVNSPNSKTGIIEYQKTLLPESLISRTDEGLGITRRLLRNTQVYDDLANESAELSLKYNQEMQILDEAVDLLDTIPDVGRRTTLQNPDLPTTYVPKDTLPVRNIEPDAVLRDEVNQLVFYHGNKSPTTRLQDIDPVQGAARSEMGVAIHLTSDQNLALGYSAASPTRNLPPVPTRKNEARGIIQEIRPRVVNPVDAAKPISDDIRDTLLTSVDAIPTNQINSIAKRILKNKIRKPETSLLDVFNKLDDIGIRYYLDDGLDFPEAGVLNAQRMITQNLRNGLGIDALVHKAPDGRVQLSLLGSPNENGIDVTNMIPTPSTIRTNTVSQAAHRNNVDAVAAQMFPNSTYAQVNAAESKVNLMTQMAQRTAEQVDVVNKELSSIADEVALQESRLRKQVIAERGERAARKEQVWRKQNDTQVNHWNKPEEGLC